MQRTRLWPVSASTSFLQCSTCRVFVQSGSRFALLFPVKQETHLPQGHLDPMGAGRIATKQVDTPPVYEKQCP